MEVGYSSDTVPIGSCFFVATVDEIRGHVLEKRRSCSEGHTQRGEGMDNTVHRALELLRARGVDRGGIRGCVSLVFDDPARPSRSTGSEHVLTQAISEFLATEEAGLIRECLRRTAQPLTIVDLGVLDGEQDTLVYTDLGLAMLSRAALTNAEIHRRILGLSEGMSATLYLQTSEGISCHLNHLPEVWDAARFKDTLRSRARVLAERLLEDPASP